MLSTLTLALRAGYPGKAKVGAAGHGPRRVNMAFPAGTCADANINPSARNRPRLSGKILSNYSTNSPVHSCSRSGSAKGIETPVGVSARGVIPPTPHPGIAGLGSAPEAAGPKADLARGGHAHFPGSRATSTRQTRPNSLTAAVELASRLDGSSVGELIREIVRDGLQRLIQLELAAFRGADWHERTEERLGHRNGYRSRTLTTQVGDIAWQIPKLRTGSFPLSILEPRRRVDQALYGVIMEADIGGGSTRKLDALVSALGSQSDLSKSQASRISQKMDQRVLAFLNWSLERNDHTEVRWKPKGYAVALIQLLDATGGLKDRPITCVATRSAATSPCCSKRQNAESDRGRVCSIPQCAAESPVVVDGVCGAFCVRRIAGAHKGTVNGSGSQDPPPAAATWPGCGSHVASPNPRWQPLADQVKIGRGWMAFRHWP